MRAHGQLLPSADRARRVRRDGPRRDRRATRRRDARQPRPHPRPGLRPDGDHLDAEATAQADAVVEWRIGGRGDGGHDRYQVAIKQGACEIARDGDRAATVVYSIGPVDFIRLVTGNASGPDLFMTGRLTIEGDLMLAAMVQSWFRVPGPAASAEA